MKILSINCGSSSLKFQMYEMPEEKVLISGVFERIGSENSFYTLKLNGEKIKIAIKLSKDEIEDNNTKIYLDDTIDLTKVIKEVKEEIKDE